MDLMARLRSLRLNLGLTQDELATLAGVSKFTITRLERGLAKRPHPGTRKKIADALGVTVDGVDELRNGNDAPATT